MVSVGTLVDRARIYCREILVEVPVRIALARYLADLPCAHLAWFLEHQNKIEAGNVRRWGGTGCGHS